MNRLLNRQLAGHAANPLVTHLPMYGGKIRLSYQDALLLQKGGTSYNALEIYIDLLSDSRIQTALTRQFGEITSRQVIIEPGNEPGEEPTQDDKDAADFCLNVLMTLQEPLFDEISEFAVLPNDNSYDTFTKNMLLAMVTHLSSAEAIWRRNKNGRAVIDRLVSVDPRRWLFEQDETSGKIMPKLVTRRNQVRGLFVPPRKFVFHRHWSVFSADPLGMGYGPSLYWLVQWKREALTFWLSVLDRYADPALIGTKPKNATPSDVANFEHALANFSRETNMVIPEGFKVDTLKANPQQSVDLLAQLVAYIDSEIMLMLTGEDTTGQKGSGSVFGNSEPVSNSIRIMKAKALSDELDRTVRSTLLRWLTRLNFPKAKIPYIKRQFKGTAEVLEIAKVYKDLGLKIDTKFLEEATGIPIQVQEAKKKPAVPKTLLNDAADS